MAIKVVEQGHECRIPEVPYLARGGYTGALYLILADGNAVRLTRGDGSGLAHTPIGRVVSGLTNSANTVPLPAGQQIILSNEC